MGDVETIFLRIGALSEVQNDAADEVGAKALAEKAESTEVRVPHEAGKRILTIVGLVF
ncbi:MAG TPA: hypothetical protein VFC93_06400 [Chloroflexota bacterium]|nr:hypothetical protein [Chloroflexota bacterium]